MRSFLFRPSLIIGPITITVDSFDNQSGINHIDLFIDDTLQYTITSTEHHWVWDEKSFSKHVIKAVAVDNGGNQAYDDLVVWKFF